MPMSYRSSRPLLAAGLMLIAGTAAADPASLTVVPAKGWRFAVYAQDLPSIENVALSQDGSVYATLEVKDGNGQVVRLKNGKRETVVAGLTNPDGLMVKGKTLYVTEETGEGRVIEVNTVTGEQRVLARLHNPEGIDFLPGGDLVLSEDSVNGRLVRLSKDGQIETILGGLNRPEGLSIARDGTIYFAETGTGRVLAFKDGNLRNIVVDLDEPDQVKLAPDGALWIAEDSPRGRLMRLKDGGLYVILSGLNSPQGMQFMPNGTVLLAEQGRGRILVITRDEPPP
jgi:sugar lactone lactonase YvrE